MKASIIVTTYKQSAILKYILISLLNQQTKYDYEIIVCDDGSLDDSYEIIRDLRNNKKNIEISYCWQQDRGFRAASARNMGISRAKGDVIILLDGDMIPRPDLVQKHLEQHVKHSKILLTGSRLVVDDSDYFNSLKEDMSFSDILSRIDKVSFLNSEELKYRQLWYHGKKPWMSVFSCNLSFPRSEHSKYSELFVGWGIEDWDLSKRLYEEGYEIKFDDSIIAYHIDYKPVISNAFRNNNHNQMVEFARNLLLFIDQYPNEDLSKCAIALKSYEIINNSFVWAGDGKNIRDEKESINLIRNWLRDNNIYIKSQDFYIQKPYKSRKEIKVVDSEAIGLLKKADNKYDQIALRLENLDPAELAKILGHANLIQSEIKAYL